MQFENTLDFAKSLDKADDLGRFREQFIFPTQNEKEFIYLCGNSLGLQPKRTKKMLSEQLNNWGDKAVEGWFEGEEAWMYYHKGVNALMGELVGAKAAEVCAMNTLTVNLHLLMVSFYAPKGKRIKIIMEKGAFPSDQYAIESQVRFNGYNPAETIIEVAPRAGEHTLRTEDIVAEILAQGDELALVLFGGVNYFTGQLFNMAAITKTGHSVGATVGFDLAHAAGNVPLSLHDWNVDFACWCSYKYQNAGPGGIGGVFVHEKHFLNTELNRFAGWWGYHENGRFLMEKGFKPEKGADGWQVSCTQVFPLTIYFSSLQQFEEAGFMQPLREKSKKLTVYLQFIISQINKEINLEQFEIITPPHEEDRGAQLSIIAKNKPKEIFNALVAKNVLGDWREPNVIRFSPVPMYNSFEDVFRAGALLLEVTQQLLKAEH
ncbi:kynureninase [Pedobacter sp. UYP30]|uniref:kynureninase n=1 Tax=Pedobacter sp. UYP30 TaxID=1756400 RepID=UPI0033981ACC